MSVYTDPRVKPHVREVAKTIRDKFGVNNIGGWGVRPNVSDHPKGLALDVMVRGAKGSAIAEWAKANARALNITYVIWNRRIWSVARDKEGWRRYVGISPHTDHVHISFLPVPVSGKTLNAGFGLDDINKINSIGGLLDGASPGGADKKAEMDAALEGRVSAIVGPLAQLASLAEFLSDSKNWFYAGMFLLGVGFLFVAFLAMTKQSGGAGVVAQSVKAVS